MGGCGTDAGSALSYVRAAAAGHLNGIHTGNEAVDRAGVGTLANAGQHTVELLNLNDREEDNLGRNVAIQLTNRYGVVDDDALNRYVTQVGLTVADASPRDDYA